MTPKHSLLGFLICFFLMGVAETHPAHEPLKPQRVHFQSRNFHNILHWQPGRAGATNSSVYFVQYKIYGQRQWKNKEDCWGIQESFCDLTNETSDVQEAYYGRVRTALAGIHSGWTMTQRFTPWWETKIDPPVMNATQVNGSLFVILRAPNIPHRNQKGRNMSMETYYRLVYRVFIVSNSLEKEQKVYEGTHRTVEIEALTPHTGYCVVAEIYRPMLDRRGQRTFVQFLMKIAPKCEKNITNFSKEECFINHHLSTPHQPNSLQVDFCSCFRCCNNARRHRARATNSFATVSRAELWRQDTDNLPRPPQAGTY